MAQASGDALSVTAGTSATGDFTITSAGTASAPSYLYVYWQPTSTPCATTVQGEVLLNARPAGNGVATLPAGPFTQQSTVLILLPGQYAVCAYLRPQSGSVSDTPAATGATTVLAYPCGDDTFSVTQVAVTSTYVVVGDATNGSATATVQIGSPGVIVTDGQSPGPANPPSTSTTVQVPGVKAGDTHDFTIAFFPEIAGASGSCVQPNGTVVTTGPDGTYHLPPVTVHVTWGAAGHSGSATINGVAVPGSGAGGTTPTAPKPAVTGMPRVGQTVACTATLPANDIATYQFYLGALLVHTTTFSDNTYEIPASAFGKLLRCVANVTDSTYGRLPMAVSDPVSVQQGSTLHLENGRPFAFVPGGQQSPGHRVVVAPTSWEPSPKSVAYQWFVGTTAISGATSNHLAITKQYVGKVLSCRVTAVLFGYGTGVAKSNGVRIH